MATKHVGKKLSMLTFEQGLVVDLIKAKLNALKALGMEEDPEVTELVQVEAEGIKDAFINFLTNPLLNFTVSELRASVEMKNLKQTIYLLIFHLNLFWVNMDLYWVC